MLRHIATMPKKESEEEESTAKRPRQDSTIEFLLGDSLVKDRSLQDEVENFLREPAVGPNADPLKWWKVNEHCFLLSWQSDCSIFLPHQSQQREYFLPVD